MGDPLVNVTFVMEQHLGHETYYRNLRRVVGNDPRISATWIGVDYDLSAAGFARLPVVSRLAVGSPAGCAQVFRGLSSSKPDVVFFNTQVPAVLGLAPLRRRPFVVATDITPRQYDRMARHYGHRPDGNTLQGRAKHVVNAGTFRRARRVVCWSSWCADSVRCEYGLEPRAVEVIAPGVDLRLWKPDDERRSGTTPRILFVGGDFHRKGGDLLLDAFERLPAASAELHIVTRSDVSSDNADVFLHRGLSPNSPELVSLFQSSDIFALPSSAEAFGIAAAEATACGLPVLATRSGGLSDVVDHGVSGFLVDADDTTALAEHLRILVDDPTLRASMAASARTRAERLFDAERNGYRIADLLVAESGVRTL